MKKNIFIINGPNLNLLGSREPSVYGHLTLDEINLQLQQKIASVNFSFFQSNNESELIEIIHRANQNANAVVLNAGGFSHTSIALADAVASISIPIFSVHISNIFNREKYRGIEDDYEKTHSVDPEYIGDLYHGQVITLRIPQQLPSESGQGMTANPFERRPYGGNQK